MSIFTDTVNSDGKEPAKTGGFQVKWCMADGCPFEARFGNTCYFHDMAEPRHWPEVTKRINHYAWMMELYNLCFSRYNKTFDSLPGWITDEERDYIAKITSEHGIDDLLPAEGEIEDSPYPGIKTKHKELPYDFGMRVLRRMEDLMVPQQYRKGYKPLPPAEESFPADEDIPF